MKARYQYRVYPHPGQQTKLAQLFGCCRVVWNDALALCKQSEKLPQNSLLQKQCITEAKKRSERAWLADVSNIPLQQSVADLGVAFSNFFSSLKGKRKGKRVNPPRFKQRNGKQSARFTRGGFSLKGSKVYLAKICRLSGAALSRQPPAASLLSKIRGVVTSPVLSARSTLKLW